MVTTATHATAEHPQYQDAVDFRHCCAAPSSVQSLPLACCKSIAHRVRGREPFGIAEQEAP